MRIRAYVRSLLLRLRSCNIFVVCLKWKFRREFPERCLSFHSITEYLYFNCQCNYSVIVMIFLIPLYFELKFILALENRDNCLFLTSWFYVMVTLWKKPTWSEVYLYFHSFIPSDHKTGFICTIFVTLVIQVYLLNTCFIHIHVSEFKFLEKTLRKL